MVRSVALCIAFAGLAVGQVDTNSVTVTASRSLSSTPDLALYQVTVTTPITASLDDVTAALQGSGLSAANLTSINTNTGTNLANVTLSWTFTLTGPIYKTKDTLASLATLRQGVVQKNPNWTVSFLFYGTQTSSAAQPSCPAADLMADARALAQKLADAAGLSLGAVSAISGTTESAGACSITVKFSLLRYQ